MVERPALAPAPAPAPTNFYTPSSSGCTSGAMDVSLGNIMRSGMLSVPPCYPYQTHNNCNALPISISHQLVQMQQNMMNLQFFNQQQQLKLQQQYEQRELIMQEEQKLLQQNFLQQQQRLHEQKVSLQEKHQQENMQMLMQQQQMMQMQQINMFHGFFFNKY